MLATAGCVRFAARRLAALLRSIDERASISLAGFSALAVFAGRPLARRQPRGHLAGSVFQPFAFRVELAELLGVLFLAAFLLLVELRQSQRGVLTACDFGQIAGDELRLERRLIRALHDALLFMPCAGRPHIGMLVVVAMPALHP